MTKEYEFEYTRQSEILILFGLAALILAIGCYLFPILFGGYIFASIVVALSLSVAFFLFNKNRLRRTAKAILSDTSIQLDLAKIYGVQFEDLKYHYDYNGKNGIVFTLSLLNGNKVRLTANNNFCNTEPLELLINQFNTVIEEYKSENHKDIIYLQSTMAKKSVIYILIPLTILVVAGLLFTTMPLMILPIAASFSLLFAWIHYFILRINHKLVDI